MPTVGSDEGLFAELLWVHGMLRRDLEACRALAARLDAGEAGDATARAEIEGLQTSGLLWTLRTRCLGYCTFVHHHHGAEDAMLFPAVRAADPASLDVVVDKLMADHRLVAALLEEVEAAASDLDVDAEGARRRLAAGLGDLSDTLLQHLAFEEDSLGPILRSWNRWPFEG